MVVDLMKVKMKSLTKKNSLKPSPKVAQCCAKSSKNVAGCHD